MFVNSPKDNTVYGFSVKSGRQKAFLSITKGFDGPSGLAIDKKNKLLYVGNRKGVAKIFNLEDLVASSIDIRMSTSFFIAIEDVRPTQTHVNPIYANKILVKSGRQKAFLSIIKGLNGPSGLAVDKKNKLLYVVNRKGVVKVFNLEDLVASSIEIRVSTSFL